MGSVPGEFPADSFTPVFLEVSRGLKRADLSGRFNTITFSGSGMKQDTSWNPARAIPLPLYEADPSLNVMDSYELYRQLVQKWADSPIPDNMPCAAVAIKAMGSYCKERDAQWIVVGLMWPENVARVLVLDYFEGALEDCISPEWYIDVSKVMSIDEVAQRMATAARNLPNWDTPILSISVIPSFLGNCLANGRMRESSSASWEYEWVYDEQPGFVDDLDVRH